MIKDVTFQILLYFLQLLFNVLKDSYLNWCVNAILEKIQNFRVYDVYNTTNITYTLLILYAVGFEPAAGKMDFLTWVCIGLKHHERKSNFPAECSNPTALSQKCL